MKEKSGYYEEQLRQYRTNADYDLTVAVPNRQIHEFEATQEYIERREKDIKATNEKISETLRRLKGAESKMEEKRVEVDGTIVDGKLTLSL